MPRFSTAVAFALLSLLSAVPGSAAAPPAPAVPKALSPDLRDFYVDLHRNPELSLHEEKTAAKVAARLRQAGFEVTTGVGGTGVVGVLQNGSGPTVMLRTELDALPVEEKTGLPYASTVRVKDDSGTEVPVMHACGHDVHMTALVGTAAEMARRKAGWHGTLVFIGQPAEERIRGARAMLQDGLFTRFPKPDFVVALHDTPNLPAGQLGVTSGYALASSDSVDLTLYAVICSFTSSGMMLCLLPPWIEPTVTTAGSCGSFSRATIVWSARTVRAAITMGSTVVCGEAPWPPLPEARGCRWWASGEGGQGGPDRCRGQAHEGNRGQCRPDHIGGSGDSVGHRQGEADGEVG